MKRCIRCDEKKDVSEFYRHRGMKDGRLNKCIPCARECAIENRRDNIDRVRAYDRARGNRQGSDYLKKYREKYPNKYRAHNMVNNYIRDNKLFKEPCEVCDTKNNIHAHHDDYLKPLKIRWLCSAHHSQWHAENGEALNP
jgi:hypothetical protein